MTSYRRWKMDDEMGLDMSFYFLDKLVTYTLYFCTLQPWPGPKYGRLTFEVVKAFIEVCSNYLCMFYKHIHAHVGAVFFLFYNEFER